jgi:hypothetical protein
VFGTVLCAIAALSCFVSDDLHRMLLLLCFRIQMFCPKLAKKHRRTVDKEGCISIAKLYTSTCAYAGQPVVGVADIHSDRRSA